MANSMYNKVLLEQIENIQKLLTGERKEVDLSGFIALSRARAELKGLTARKTWFENEVLVINPFQEGSYCPTINAHAKAVGDLLGALGYRGSFHITRTLRLGLGKLVEEEKPDNVTIAEILAKIKTT